MVPETPRFPSPEQFPGLTGSGGRASLPRVILMLMAAAAGYLVLSRFTGNTLLELFPADGLTLPETLFFVAGGPVVLWLVVLAHELGHVIGGRMAGFRFHSLAAGLIEIRVIDGSRRIGLPARLGRTAGHAVCVPEREDSLREGMILFVAGGPVASLLAGLIGVFLFLILPGESGFAAATRVLAGLFGISSLIVATATMLPSGSGDFLSDGSRMRRLTRGDDPRSARDVALLTLSAREMAGHPPREWDANLIETALIPQEPDVFRLHALLFRFRRLMDSGDAAGAGQALVHALDLARTLGPAMQRQAAEEAVRYAIGTGQPEVAADWQAIVDGGAL